MQVKLFKKWLIEKGLTVPVLVVAVVAEVVFVVVSPILWQQ